MKRIIIDTDTASDDAVALVMALREPTLEVAAITTVAGNVDVERATENALMTIDYAGTYTPPVFKGAAKPLLHEHRDASGVHGLDGMGDLGTLSESSRSAEAENGVDALIRLAGEGGCELLALGPLTNVALAINKAPEAMRKLKRITLMGGMVARGNTGPMSEFNIWEDAEAADIVFCFGVPITMVPIEVCRGNSAVTEEDVARLRERKSPLTDFCIDCNRTLYEGSAKFAGKHYFTLPDATAAAVLARPELVTTQYGSYTRIELRGEFTYGATVNDIRDRGRREFLSKGTVLHPYNCEIVRAIDSAEFKRYMFELIA